MSERPDLNLLDLPREVLTQIFQPFLSTLPGTQIPLLDRRRRRRTPMSLTERSSVFKDASQIVPILLIHPIIYALSITILYGPQHVFTLDLTGSKHSHARSVFSQAASPTFNDEHLPPEDRNILRNWLFLRNISSLKITLDRLRGWTSEHIIPLLQRMILSGSLKYIHVHLDTSAENDAWNVYIFDKLTQGTPLRAFVDLLGDPDLRLARLTLSDVHDEAWCEFHRDEGRKSVSECRKRMLVASRGAEKRDREVEIEWWRLAKEADEKGAQKYLSDD